MRKLLLSSILICGLGVPALAADAVVEEVIDIAPVFSWTGGYIGLQGGYLWGEGEVRNDDGSGSDPDIDGWLGGVYAGYNYQVANNVVLGVDADFAWTGAGGRGVFFDSGGAPVPASGDTLDLDWTGALRARLGYAVDRFLPYVAGGVAFADVDRTLFNDTGDPVGSADGTFTGWTIGVGLEYAFTDNLIGRAEYRYTDFGDEDLIVTGGSTTELTSNDVRLGIAYKF